MKVGNRRGNGSGWSGREGTGKTIERRVRKKWEQAEGEGMEKIPPLVGDVQEYENFYGEEGVDTNLVWFVQHKKRPKWRT